MWSHSHNHTVTCWVDVVESIYINVIQQHYITYKTCKFSSVRFSWAKKVSWITHQTQFGIFFAIFLRWYRNTGRSLTMTDTLSVGFSLLTNSTKLWCMQTTRDVATLKSVVRKFMSTNYIVTQSYSTVKPLTITHNYRLSGRVQSVCIYSNSIIPYDVVFFPFSTSDMLDFFDIYLWLETWVPLTKTSRYSFEMILTCKIYWTLLCTRISGFTVF